jgi:hypothetical protein
MATEKSVDSSIKADLVPDRARRLLLRGGAATAPVLLTIASAPVTAAQCVTTSASTSMSSRQSTVSLSCTGNSPETWLMSSGANSGSTASTTASTAWPSTRNSSSARFNEFFDPKLMDPNGNVNPGPKLTDVLASSYPNKLARACAASLLNLESNRIPAAILTPLLLKQIWRDASSPNGFQATAGVKWNADQAATWLAKTWGG